MKSDNNLDVTNLEQDIDNLSKKLFLESPDLYIDFKGKINDNVFDEMVLFFASKYNFISIIKDAVDNNSIDLNSASKNKSYPSIIRHLMSVAIQNNNNDIYNYFETLLNNEKDTNTIPNKKNNLKSTKAIYVSDPDCSIDNKIIHNEEQYTYTPEYFCTKCNSNIFESGYSVCETIIYKYCIEKEATSEVSRNMLNKITCCNCNNDLEQITLKQLNDLCTLRNCTNCSSNLTVSGIVDKSKMVFDNELNKFIPSSTSYHCAKCDNKINNKQKEHFNL